MPVKVLRRREIRFLAERAVEGGQRRKPTLQGKMQDIRLLHREQLYEFFDADRADVLVQRHGKILFERSGQIRRVVTERVRYGLQRQLLIRVVLGDEVEYGIERIRRSGAGVYGIQPVERKQFAVNQVRPPDGNRRGERVFPVLTGGIFAQQQP